MKKCWNNNWWHGGSVGALFYCLTRQNQRHQCVYVREWKHRRRKMWVRGDGLNCWVTYERLPWAERDLETVAICLPPGHPVAGCVRMGRRDAGCLLFSSWLRHERVKRVGLVWIRRLAIVPQVLTFPEVDRRVGEGDTRTGLSCATPRGHVKAGAPIWMTPGASLNHVGSVISPSPPGHDKAVPSLFKQR